jgi:adenylate cyclase
MNGTGEIVIEFPKEGCVAITKEQTILEAALSSGIPMFHACGGNAKCSTCRILVIEGGELLSAPNEKEITLRKQMHFPPNVRLSCQTYVRGGPVKARRIIQDETDIGLYIGSAAGDSTQQLGEEKELVLFFLDIRNFTQFVETHLPFDVIHIIRKLFNMFQNIIESNGGRIIETAGDGIYAVFGCDINRAASAYSAAQSALSILDNIKELNESYFETHFGETVQVGIGVHIGNVISGSVKIGSEDHTIVMGLPVNIAARLQNATKELNNSIVVSSNVYDLLGSSSITGTSDSVTLKGITEPLTVYLIGKPYR